MTFILKKKYKSNLILDVLDGVCNNLAKSLRKVFNALDIDSPQADIIGIGNDDNITKIMLVFDNS